MFFNKEPFPANESNENAHNLCTSVKEAKNYCPKRWETMEKWFAEARRVRVYLRASILAILHTHYEKRIPEINVKTVLSGIRSIEHKRSTFSLSIFLLI